MEKIEWLRKEINARGGEVLGAETEHRVQIVEHALRHLGKLVGRWCYVLCVAARATAPEAYLRSRVCAYG
jgi:hypothetical protein